MKKVVTKSDNGFEVDLTIPMPPRPCRRCSGFGYLTYSFRNIATAMACPSCNGTGKSRVTAIRLSSGSGT